MSTDFKYIGELLMGQSVLFYMFYFTSILGIITLFFVKKIDARTVFFGGTVVYGLPLYWGYTEYTLSHKFRGLIYHEYIVDEVYIIFILCQLVYLISLIKIKKSRKNTSKLATKSNIINYNHLLFSLYISLIVSVILFVLTSGIETFSIATRSEKISNYTVWYFISGTIAVITTILSIILKKNWRYFILPISYLLFDLIMGDRTFIFLGIISFFITYFNSREITMGFKGRLKIGATLVFILIVAFIYKPIYFAISLNYFRYEDIGQYINQSIIGSEPFIIIGNLNEIVRFGGIHLDKSYLINQLLGYLPLYETITMNSRESFNSLFQGILFPFTEWGLASTSFGELYSIGKMVAIIIYLFSIYLFLKTPTPKTIFIKLWYFFIVPYILFYFHRTDWHNFIGMTRFFVYSHMLIIPIYVFITLITKNKRFRIKN